MAGPVNNSTASTAASAPVRRAAAVVSFVGHPLLTTLAFAAFVAWEQLQGQAAVWFLGSVAAVAALVSLWNLRKARRGDYSNFDVSERKQRRSFYPVLLGLLGLATAVMAWQGLAGPVQRGMLVAWLLLVVCYVLNFWLKVSLHAALSFFLAGAVLHLSPDWGGLAFVAAALIAASRLVLQRHTLPELLVGAGLGSVAGGALGWL